MIGVGDWAATPGMIEAVTNVLKSGRISYGPYSKKFEAKIAAMHINSFGVLANSGTSALLVALEALKEIHNWADGSEVIVPASTFVATYNIVTQARLKPVLVDVDPVHYLIDSKLVSKAITSKTKAIIPVHLFGQPADVRNVAYMNGLKVIEDSCECLGLKSIAVSDITCFSFYVSHILSTGIGGMAITDNSIYATIMRSLVNHGRNNIYIARDDGKDRLHEVIGARFSFLRQGYSYRITELESALGVAQLPYLAEWLTIRRSNALRLKNNLILKGLADNLQLPGELVEGEHAWMMFPIVCETPNVRRFLCSYLEEHGVETREALPLVTQPVYKIEKPEELYPNAYRLATCGFYVGCHQGLTNHDMAYIADVIKGWFCDNGSYI